MQSGQNHLGGAPRCFFVSFLFLKLVLIAVLTNNFYICKSIAVQCCFLMHHFSLALCFSIGKKYLTYARGDFCIECRPSVFCVRQTVLYIKWMQVVGFIQSFHNRVCILGVYVKCFCL